MINLCLAAIPARRQLELDYSREDGEQRWGRVVCPFDVGSRNPTFADRNKDKVAVFSVGHCDKDGNPAPMIVMINIDNIQGATLLDSVFDPSECNELSMATQRRIGQKPYDWLSIPDGFNIARDRNWP